VLKHVVVGELLQLTHGARGEDADAQLTSSCITPAQPTYQQPRSTKCAVRRAALRLVTPTATLQGFHTAAGLWCFNASSCCLLWPWGALASLTTSASRSWGHMSC
jgi:hypothetical protein